jgi:copper transport protein
VTYQVHRLHSVPREGQRTTTLPSPRLLRPIVATLLTIGLFTLLQSLNPGAAWAHPYLVRTLPQAGYAVATPPSEIGLVFDETVTFNDDAIVVDGQSRGIIATSPPTASRQSQKLTVQPETSLPSGRYVVRWQVIGEDGHPVTGSFSFGVGSGPLPTGSASSTETPGLAAGSLFRWFVFVGLAVALGGLVGDRLVQSRLTHAHSHELNRPRPWVTAGALAGLIGTAGLAIHQLGGGSLLAGVRNFDASALWAAGPGQMLVLQAAGFTLALLFGAKHRPAAILALLVALGAEAGRNHLQVEAGISGWLLVAVHLVAAAVWVGALIHVSRAAFSWRGHSRSSRDLFLHYSALALALYLVVVGTGTLGAVVLLPSLEALVDSPYGRVLLAKLALVVAVTTLALLARRSLRRGRPVRRGLGLKGLVAGERTALVGILLLTAVLSSMPTPRSADSETIAYPPPIRGDVIRLGALAGQVNVGLVTAQRHLEVQLEVPELDPDVDQTYRLDGTVTNPRGVRRTIDFQSCGNGCFYATPVWKRGTSKVSLSVSAPGWRGRRAVLEVPWPVRNRSDLLDRVLKTLPQEPTVVVDEWVSSDTSRPVASMPPEPMTGKELFRAEPYKSGKVGTVFELKRTGEGTWIGFGLRSEQVYVRLLVAPNGRLVREEIVSPRHLIRHEFGYPDGEGTP